MRRRLAHRKREPEGVSEVADDRAESGDLRTQSTAAGGGSPVLPSFLGPGATAFAFLYFTGWMYHYYFFRYLAVPMGAVEVPAQTLVTLSFTVIYARWWQFLLLACVTLGSLAAAASLRPWIAQSVGLLAIASAFLGTFVISHAAGRAEALHLRTGKDVVPVRIVLTPEAKRRAPASLRRAMREHNLRSVATTDQALYLLYQPEQGTLPERPMGYLYAIPRQTLLTTQFMVDN